MSCYMPLRETGQDWPCSRVTVATVNGMAWLIARTGLGALNQRYSTLSVGEQLQRLSRTASTFLHMPWAAIAAMAL